MPLYLFEFLIFLGFLWPITVDAVSINYSFVFFPAILILTTQKCKIPPKNILSIISLYFIIYLLSFVFNISTNNEYINRILASFFIFISIFSYCFIDIIPRLIKIFKLAIVFITLIFSIESLFLFFHYGGSAAGYILKDEVGSQRYGFVYLMAFYIIYFSESENKIFRLLKIILLMIVLTCLLMTFSRASLVAFIASFIMYIFINFNKNIINLKIILKAISGIFFIGIFIFIIKDYFPIIEHFFYDRLFDRYINGDPVEYLSPETSEGTRLEIWRAIVSHTISSPLWGSGYLGTWILSDIIAGSAHSQYMDVLFRIGIIGFLCYLVLLIILFKFLYYYDNGLFYGGIGMLIYGFFHETFKESYGAFILAFLIGIYCTYSRAKKNLASINTQQ